MRKNLALMSLAATAIAPLLAQASSAQLANTQLATSGSLTAEVSALRNKTGQVCFSLFNSSKGFPNDPASIVETRCISAESSVETDAAAIEDDEARSSASETQVPVAVTFESLPLGTYAVSAFHDENEDGEINQGGFGIPLEGFGFSKNPRITTQAPEFSETAVIVVGQETTTEIELIYY